MSAKKTPPRRNKKNKQSELNNLFAELKAEYLATFDEKILQIEKLWQQFNRKQLESEFHKIKGTGTTYGVREATQLAEVMEDLCHQNAPKLGFCIMLSLDILKKIAEYHREDRAYEIYKDVSFKFLRDCQDELESA